MLTKVPVFLCAIICAIHAAIAYLEHVQGNPLAASLYLISAIIFAAAFTASFFALLIDRLNRHEITRISEMDAAIRKAQEK